jgi:hypothetical protein
VTKVKKIVFEDVRNEFIFLLGDGVSPGRKKNDGKLHHCV